MIGSVLSGKGALLACIASITIVGCSNNNTSGDLDDKRLEVPVVPAQAENIPEPMGWNKGAAEGAIDTALDKSKDSFDINERLRLKSMLSGYHNFDNYVMEAQIRDDGATKKLYAKTGSYNAKTNRFVINSKDIISSGKKELDINKEIQVKPYDIECWRDGQPMHDKFLSDLSLINSFISSQTENNKDFLIEVFLENTNQVEGSINLVIRQEASQDISKNHNQQDVLSLNTTLIMTGFCPTNEKTRSNSIFYNDIAMSNLIGPWGIMDQAVREGWWIMPLAWDGLDARTKGIYKKLYESKNQ